MCVCACVHACVCVANCCLPPSLWSLETWPLALCSCSLRLWVWWTSGTVSGAVVRAQEWQAGGPVIYLPGPQSPHLPNGDDNNPCSLDGGRIQGSQGLGGAL